MSDKLDLVIRGGEVADGLGGPMVRADIGVRDGRIVEVGTIRASGHEEIDARHAMVTPGFVDVHTHYDGQAIWSQRLSPSSAHGVTTAIMGNCGVGFAPVRPTDHAKLIELMEGVEDIPGVAIEEGLDWQWESFADYLNALERQPHDMDFGAQLPHAALRVYVMGERAIRLEMANADDRARMRELTTEAMRAGAIGFTTSRSINHRTVAGAPTPTLRAAEEELTEIAMGVRDAGTGVLQMITDFDEEDVTQEFGFMRRLVEKSGRPLSYSLMQKHNNPNGWKRVLELTAEAVRDGLPMRAQVAPRGVGTLIGMQGSRCVFASCPSYQKIAHLPLAERVRLMRDPALRATLIGEIDVARETLLGERLTRFSNIYTIGNPPDYDPGPERSITAIAAREGRSPAEVAYDMMLLDDGRAMLYSPFANYADQSIDVCGEMLADPNTIIGLGDGGAHVSVIADSSFQTFALSHWGNATGRFSLPWLIKRQTSDTARAVGLLDRGVIAPGMKADLNVLAPDKLSLDLPHMQADLPAGGRRLLQRAGGYVATIVSGAVTYRDGEATGALPGRLVRGPQAAPAAAA